MRISPIMFISRILIDLCAIKQNIIKKTFADIVCKALVVKEY